MITIKDSMVLIHLAKMDLLDDCCNYFKKVYIPVKVKEEVLRKNHEDSIVISELIGKNKIRVAKVKNIHLVEKAHQFNIQRAEAEAVALYWELKADFIATDDNNVRKKKDILKLRIIGTPAILLILYENKKITRIKLETAIKRLRQIGWFSTMVWDKILLEVDKNA